MLSYTRAFTQGQVISIAIRLIQTFTVSLITVIDDRKGLLVESKQIIKDGVKRSNVFLSWNVSVILRQNIELTKLRDR